MNKHLQFIDGTSDKFWQIETQGLQYTVTYGRNGTSGVAQVKTFSTEEDCMIAAEKVLAEKIKKGYSENGEVVLSEKTVNNKPNKAGTDIATIIKEYDEIIKSKKMELMLPFLQTYSKGNVVHLKKHIKHCKRYWMTYVDLTLEPNYKKKADDYGTWGMRGDKQIGEMITLSAIGLMDKTDILSWDEVMPMLNNVAKKEPILQVLEWAKPNWIELFLLDKIKKNSWTPFHYSSLRYLEQHQLVQFQPELFAVIISNFGLWNNNFEPANIDKLILTDITAYTRDVPELFNYFTGIFNAPQVAIKEGSLPTNIWTQIFQELVKQNKMEKLFLAEQSLLIQTKGWDKNLKSFFREQITLLALSTIELIGFQEVIFTFLQDSTTAIVSYGVELVKAMYLHPQFATASFLDWVEAVMMRGDCKGPIKSILPILEKITKINTEHQQKIALLIADVFVIQDLTIQEKATKVFLKVANENDMVVREKISSYASLMQGGVKISLQQFLDAESLFVDEASFTNYSFAPTYHPKLLEPVVMPSTWNEILFLFGKFLSSDQVIDSEILVNVFITQTHLFPTDYKLQLAPYTVQLEKTYFESVQKNYTRSFLLLKIADLFKSFTFDDGNYKTLKTLSLINPLLIKVMGKMNAKSNLPLLCMPTHLPYWVAPHLLLQRIIAYEASNEKIELLDLCMAISRMPLEQLDIAIPMLDNLSVEMKNLFSFCFGINTEIQLAKSNLFSRFFNSTNNNDAISEQYLCAWAVAARTFYPNQTFNVFESTALKNIPFVTAPLALKYSIEEKWVENKNYNTGKMEKVMTGFELRINLPEKVKAPKELLYSQDVFLQKEEYAWYSVYRLQTPANAYFWHSIMPQNNDALACVLLQTACKTNDGTNQELHGFLKIINHNNFVISDATLLVFACCFYQEKKEVRLFATEVLIQLIEKQAIQLEKLAEYFTFFILNKYGVFLRMVEGIVAIKDVSPLHNAALYILLEGIFQNITLLDKLPTNFKKLVENYIDVLAKTNQKPTRETIVFFENWKTNDALQSLIKQIIK